MGRFSCFLLVLVCVVQSSSCIRHLEQGDNIDQQQVYIVYLGSKVHPDPDVTCAHNHEVLASVHEGRTTAAREFMVYSYKHGFRGFSARLTKKQAEEIAKRDDVLAVFRSRPRKIHTTHSWNFLGLQVDDDGRDPEARTIPHSDHQEDVIIGVIDTGVWPELPSFSDVGMSSVPSRWRGECERGELFNSSTCNRKLIGARYYLRGLAAEVGPLASMKEGGLDYISPRDSIGHGTHTASTATGRYVENASFMGFGQGSAAGGAPRARLAVYKACWSTGCFDADILAAFDDAIKDGVDVLSVSLGPDPPQTGYFEDTISIGSFHAFQKGVVVACSAGNNGDSTAGPATNVAPWIITVGAGSMDRDFVSYVVLGNNASFKGASLASSRLSSMQIPLVYAGTANTSRYTPHEAEQCLNHSLRITKVKDKIVICRQTRNSLDPLVGKSEVVRAAGAKGMILIDETDRNVALPFVLPTTLVSTKDGDAILAYMNCTNSPTASLTPAATRLGVRPAPQVAAFSSRGPNSVTPDILKPDVIAPGVNILAAWSPGSKDRPLNFNIISGTSMAAPHVSGVVALLRAVHPLWSPAAIKSAIMTTAYTRDNTKSPMLSLPDGAEANAFDYGGGHIYPRKANNPGLVYDIDAGDFVAYLCGTGYTTRQLQRITGDRSSCPSKALPITDLNYPAFVISELSESLVVTRTLTYVGAAENTTFTPLVKVPAGITARVDPDELEFTYHGEKRSYTVEFGAVVSTAGSFVFGSLTWMDGRHSVRSQIAVKTSF